MKKLRLLITAFLVVFGLAAFSQGHNDYIHLVAGGNQELSGSGSAPMDIADNSVNEEIDGYLALRKGVSDGMMEPEYGSRIQAFGVSNEELGKMIVIQPNPVVDRFKLKIPREVGQVKSAGIYNIEGLKVRGFGNRITGRKNQEFELNATDLVPEIYFLRIETEFGMVRHDFSIQ